MYLGKSGQRTMFSIETDYGRSIQNHSCYPREDEILLPPGFYMNVVDISNPADDLYIIHMRGGRPPYKMLVEPFDVYQWRLSLDAKKKLVHTGGVKVHHALDAKGKLET